MGTNKEFNLSEKEHDLRNLVRVRSKSCPYYCKEDIKEFIKKLKEELDFLFHDNQGRMTFKALIDKLAGENFTL